MKALVVLMLIAACGGEYRPARDTYNEGVAALAAGEHEKAEKLLVEARSAAGVDPELRFRAAFDLGVAYAQHAQKIRGGQQDDLPKALELAQQSVSWFNDAQRLRKTDEPTKANLAVMRARVQALSDELRKGEAKLEARLDEAIKEQRGVLDEARVAWYAIKQTGGSDPLAEQGPLTHLADRERGIVSEVGVVSDLAVDEIDQIAKKPEDKRTDEEKVRVVQLKSLDIYVTDARARIAEARRKLQDLAPEEGVARAEAALVALKRAREQLLDPINVLRGVAQDQVALLQETAYGGGKSDLLGKLDGRGSGPEPLPAWLAPALLAERQGGLRDRVSEVKARLFAAVDPANPPPEKQDPKQAKLLDRVRAALPGVGEAYDAMEQAKGALAATKLTEAMGHERKAVEALARAIEQFSDLKQTVELAYGEQQAIGKLLSPEAKGSGPEVDMDAKERGTQTKDGLARNVDRMKRLQGLIADALADASQPAPEQGPDGKPIDPKQKEAHEQAAAQAKQLYARAEQLRGEIASTLETLHKAIADNKEPLVPQRDAETKLSELRKLFFSVVEHLKQLIRDQGETRDQSSAIAGADDIARAPKLPGLIGREVEHSQMAKAIVDALAAQADAAGKQPPQQGQPDAKTLSAAAEEVRQADASIDGARGTLTKVKDATTQSMSMKPVLEDQAKALEHLEAALKLLEPPQKNDNKQDQQKQQQQDQQKQDQQKQDQQQQQQQGAAQRARDEDARQQKRRRDREAGNNPVEKDW